MKITIPKKFHRQRWNIVNLLIALLVTLFVIYPVIIQKGSGIFFSVDPDSVYTANALLYVKESTISYLDHPGTPAISALSFALIPLRLFAKFVQHEKFIEWSFYNFEKIFVYLRLFQSTLLFASLTIYLIAVSRYTKSLLLRFLAVAILAGFLPFYYVGLSISAESITFLFASIWILIFTLYMKKKKQFFIFVLFFVSGLMFSNRATAFFYIPATWIIYLWHYKRNVQLRGLITTVLLVLTGFMVGLWPLKEHFLVVIQRLLFFASSTGTHGSGSTTFMDVGKLMLSVKTFFYRDPIFCTVTIITFFISIGRVIKNRSDLLGLLGICFTTGSFIFSKFPLAHYQIPNFIFVSFLFLVSFSKSLNIYKLLITVTFLVAALPIAENYNRSINDAILKSKSIDNFVSTVPAGTPVIWEWARSKEFSLIWVRDWSGGIYDEELRSENIYGLAGDLTQVRTGVVSRQPITDFKNSVFIIQDATLDSFIENNPGHLFITRKIENADGLNEVHFSY